MTQEIKQATLMDSFLPIYNFNEVHTITVQASTIRVFQAIKDLTYSELSPLVHFLFALRSLPNRLSGNNKQRLNVAKPILEQILDISFILLAEEANHELVLGTIGQFWRAKGNSNGKPARTVHDFITFHRPGYAKAVMNFCVEDCNDRVKVITETRIYASDQQTRAKFSAYWRLIYPGSAFIRIMWLKAIKHQAEH